MVSTEKEGSGCLRWALYGCGCVVLGGIVTGGLFAAWVGTMYGSFRQAAEVQTTLDERWGEPDDWVAPPDGGLDPDKLEALIAVQSAVRPSCEAIGGFFANVESLDAAEREGTEPSPFEVLRVVKGAFGMAPALGDLIERRNRAMVEAEIGLGELTWLWVLAYHAGPDVPPSPQDQQLDGEARRTFVKILEHTADGAEGDLAAALTQEAQALRDDRDRIPFADGLPAPFVADLEPYRSRLDELACPALLEFMLARAEQQGMSIQMH